MKNIASVKGKKLAEFPHLVKELCNVDNETLCIRAGSHKILNWKCPNEQHPIYAASVLSRTRNQTGCKECHYNVIRKLDKNVRTNLLDTPRKRINQKCNENGISTETFVESLLKKDDRIHHIETYAQYNAFVDLVVYTKADSIGKQVQIKTITKANDRYFVTLDKKYKDNMLIVACSNDRDLFAVCFWKEIKHVKRLSLTKSEKSMYKHMIFDDSKTFVDKIVSLLPCALQFENIRDELAKPMLLEYDMTQRLAAKCAELGYVFTKQRNNDNPIDVYINGKTIQLKYSTYIPKGHITFSVTIEKCLCRYNNKNVKQPYSIDDGIDFFVIELNDNQNKYQGMFCVIPIEILIEMGYIKSDNQNGKRNLYICPPIGYNKKHWSMQYWNRFDLLA